MTTEEEMKRLGQTERPYSVLSEIIDDCLIEKPGISSYDMCLGDYQFLLHKLRVVTYGPQYKTSSVCPYCSSTNEKTINLEELEVSEYTDDVSKYFNLELPISKKNITLRMQTPRTLDDITSKVKGLRKKSSNFLGDPAFLFTIESLIDTVDGNRLDAVKLPDFVKALPMMDTNYIVKYSEKLNESIGIKAVLELDCPICGLAYKSPFRITSEFFGPSIDI